MKAKFQLKKNLKMQMFYVRPQTNLTEGYRILQETHQEMRYPNVILLYFVTPLACNAPDRGVSLGLSP